MEQKGQFHTKSSQRPKFELRDIFNRYWEGFCAHHKYSRYQEKVVHAIQDCRTKKLGGHIASCSNTDCDYTINAYNSCRNRNCPKCQLSKQLEWVRNRLLELLPIPYFHHVFTLPHLLNNLALCNKVVIYGLFFQSCNYTLNAFSKDPRFLKAKCGGIAEDGRHFKRLPYQEKFLFPVKAMSRTLRGKFVKLLKKAYQEGQLRFPGKLAEIQEPEAFEDFCKQVGRQEWVNYTKKPF